MAQLSSRRPIVVTSGLAQLKAPVEESEPFGGVDPDDFVY